MTGYVVRAVARFVLTVVVTAAIALWLLGLAPSPAGSAHADLFGNLDLGSAPIGAALAVTLPLILIALILSAALGAGLGIWAARRPGSLVDRALGALLRIGGAVPSFWLGTLLVLLFSATLRWLPAGGFVPWQVNPLVALSSLILPALALALPQAARLGSMVRRALVDAQTAPYLVAAEARGLTADAAMRRHGLRNALLAVLGALGPQVTTLIAGALVVENVFYLSGLGRLLFDAVAARDLGSVRAAALVLIVLLAGAALMVKLGAGWADPRVHAERKA